VGWLDYIDKTSFSSGNLGYTILAFAMSIVIAGVAGHVAYTFKPVGKTYLGALAGYFLGNFVYNLFFIYWNKALATLIVCQAVFTLIGGYLGYKLRDGFTIISTSILGAYLIVRGISFFAGGYPDELDLYQDITSG
jgi:hypothetical protein